MVHQAALIASYALLDRTEEARPALAELAGINPAFTLQSAPQLLNTYFPFQPEFADKLLSGLERAGLT
jgi:hypothetical protein